MGIPPGPSEGSEVHSALPLVLSRGLSRHTTASTPSGGIARACQRRGSRRPHCDLYGKYSLSVLLRYFERNIFLSGEVLPENTPVFDFNRQALRLRRLASSGDRLGVASSYESGRRRVDGKTAIREGRYVTLRRDRGRSACGGPNSPTRILPLYSPHPCFVLPASTYESALLSSLTVSDRFLPRGPQYGFNATCDER